MIHRPSRPNTLFTSILYFSKSVNYTVEIKIFRKLHFNISHRQSYRIVFLNLYSADHGRDHSVALPVRRPPRVENGFQEGEGQVRQSDLMILIHCWAFEAFYLF